MSSRPAAWNTPLAPVSWRQVALPVEHGGWGLLAEPLVLGLILAPSAAGAALAIAGLLAFLARHPLKIALTDRRRGSRHPRTAAAERMAAAYAAGALLALGLAAPVLPASAWMVIAAAAPLAAVQLAYDVRLQ
ncbi:MAG TPA: YwiC-like family protein, partial [Vicinamibacteria bacterium]|nr:YwiC-like family protein [Vicinamibacteria bacterium]